jgi:hypothetical protein
MKLGVGRENAKHFLRQDKKLMKEISKQIWQAVRMAEKADKFAIKEGGVEEGVE